MGDYGCPCDAFCGCRTVFKTVFVEPLSVVGRGMQEPPKQTCCNQFQGNSGLCPKKHSYDWGFNEFSGQWPLYSFYLLKQGWFLAVANGAVNPYKWRSKWATGEL